DAAGTWHPIDRTLARMPAGDWKNTSGPFTVDLADRADAAAVATVGQGAWSIGFSLQGAQGGAATASGETATYLNAMAGIDLDEAVTASGLKESVVVNTLTAGTGDLTGGGVGRQESPRPGRGDPRHPDPQPFRRRMGHPSQRPGGVGPRPRPGLADHR